MTTVPHARRLVRALAMAALVALPACYTTFGHPRLVRFGYRTPSGPCARCHDTDELLAFVAPPGTVEALARRDRWTLWDRMPHRVPGIPARADSTHSGASLRPTNHPHHPDSTRGVRAGTARPADRSSAARDDRATPAPARAHSGGGR